ESLRKSFTAYLDAFMKDLNQLYPGVAALQMGANFLELSDTSDMWRSTFNDETEADRYRAGIVQQMPALRDAVSASIDASLAGDEKDDPGRVWAELSKADVLFLTDRDDDRVVHRYRTVIPRETPFVWDAARGQLQLFADLGVHGGRAEKVIA